MSSRENTIFFCNGKVYAWRKVIVSAERIGVGALFRRRWRGRFLGVAKLRQVQLSAVELRFRYGSMLCCLAGVERC